MKKSANKKSKDNLVTKEYLDKKIKETGKNLTKDLKSHLDKRIDGVMKYMDYRFERVEGFINEFSEFKNNIMKTLDWLVGAFKKFDEEHTVMSQQNIDVNDELDNHELRLKTLESKSLN